MSERRNQKEATRTQDFNARVQVENEASITLSAELTDAIRVEALAQAESKIAEAHELVHNGIRSQDDARDLAETVKQAHRFAEVVYTLTLDEGLDDRVD